MLRSQLLVALGAAAETIWKPELEPKQIVSGGWGGAVQHCLSMHVLSGDPERSHVQLLYILGQEKTQEMTGLL
jgi:hypothetical protein